MKSYREYRLKVANPYPGNTDVGFHCRNAGIPKLLLLWPSNSQWKNWVRKPNKLAEPTGASYSLARKLRWHEWKCTWIVPYTSGFVLHTLHCDSLGERSWFPSVGWVWGTDLAFGNKAGDSLSKSGICRRIWHSFMANSAAHVEANVLHCQIECDVTIVHG